MFERSKIYTTRLKKFVEDVTIYPVSCEKLAHGRSDEQWLDEVLDGGARIVQLRDKDSSDRRLLEKAKYFRSRTREKDALFIVNDRVDIALMADADGVHLGQKDFPPQEVAAVAPDMIIGLSCNSEDQAQFLGKLEREEKLPVSYYNIGPLFPTQTKDGLSNFIGLEAIKLFSSYLSLPFTVMGGIKLEDVPDLVGMGATRIAVVTALTKAENIALETGLWVKAITSAQRK